MRINKYLALYAGVSRRSADKLVLSSKVKINGVAAKLGSDISNEDSVTLEGKVIRPDVKYMTVMINKPVGYVVSKSGQGSKTIYELLPNNMQHLKPVGRLDKDSSGLLIVTNNGDLANQLTHPSFNKIKIYKVRLESNLSAVDKQTIEKGVLLEDGLSRLTLQGNGTDWKVTMNEGRNRQIRRTFASAGYEVKKLHRIQFGEFILTDDLKPAAYRLLNS